MRAVIKMYDFGIFLSIDNVLSISQDLKGLGNKVYYCLHETQNKVTWFITGFLI